MRTTLSRKRHHRRTAILTYCMRIAYNNYCNTCVYYCTTCNDLLFISILSYILYRSKRDGQIILRLSTNIERKEVNKNCIE